MSNDILDIIKERQSTFSKGQRLIAKYITEDYDKAAFMTANRLGKTVGVSESTVVRFAAALVNVLDTLSSPFFQVNPIFNGNLVISKILQTFAAENFRADLRHI